MATLEQQVQALTWAAGMRGAHTQEEALDWMVARGLAAYDNDGFVLTGEGMQRGDEIFDELQRVPASKRARTNAVLWLAGAVVIVRLWRRR